MLVAVNTRLLLPGKLEGIGWFTCQTLKRITRSNPQVHFIFLFDRPFSEEFIFSDNITPLILSPQARHPLLYYAWLQFSVKPVLKKLKPDVFLSPDGLLPLGLDCPSVPVIHDINFLHYPQHSKWLTAKYYNYFFPRFAKQAARIATVSEFSKSEIVQHYGIDPKKIDVVYNGTNEFFKPLTEEEKKLARDRFTGGKPYFVYVGSLHPRKNIVALLRAFALFRNKTGSDMMLVLAGPSFWGTKEIDETIRREKLKDHVKLTGRLANEELALVLGAAAALTFVPLYEGFGIPLVEAMTCEVPVITSHVSSLPEIAGDAALLVSPYTSENISEAMEKVVADPALAASLVQRGKQKVKEFSWDRSAQLLWQTVLDSVRN